MTRAIITYIDDKMKRNFEKDFLFTLRNTAEFHGRVFVIYYGDDQKFSDRIKKVYNADVIFKKNSFIISNQRNIDLLSVLDNLPDSILNVMCVDGGDIWFQSSFDEAFEITKDSYGFVEENSGADEGLNLKCLTEIRNEKIRMLFFEKARRQKLVNSGMIIGKKEFVRAIIKEISSLTYYLNQDFFALDQTIFNYVVRNDGQGIVLPSVYNYTLISNVGKFYTNNRLFYTCQNKLINIVHNCGNIDRLLPNGRDSMKTAPKSYKKLPGSFWGVTSFFNPAGYKNKIKNYRRFRESSRKQGLKLIAVEAAFRGKPFELNKDDADILIQVKCNSILWQKERLINIAIKHLPKDCDKFCWLDNDIIFLDDDWINKTSKLLEEYNAVQLFSKLIRLPKNFRYFNVKDPDFYDRIDKHGYKTFSISYGASQLGGEVLKSWANPYFEPGIWASRTSIFRKYGVYDRSCSSIPDLYMAHLFINNEINGIAFNYINESIAKDFNKWGGKIKNKINKSIYYFDGVLVHLWHGNENNRNYWNLVKLMNDYNFDPNKDIKLGDEGGWEWSSNKPELHESVENYFLLRNENDSKFRIFLNKFLKYFTGLKTDFLDFLRIICYNILKLKKDFIFKSEYRLGIFGKFLKRNFLFIYRPLKKFSGFFSIIYDNNIYRILRKNWWDYKFDLNPIDRKMRILDFKGVEGMNSENIRFLINETVRKFAKNGVYLEVGTYRGSSLISAALFNPSTRCIGIDNFSQFDPDNSNKKCLMNNLKKFPELKNIEFYGHSYKKVLKTLFDNEKNLKIDVYYYDGRHSYNDQIFGLRAVLPYLSENCIIIVDDFNWDFVEKANKDFLLENSKFKSLFKMRTLKDGSPDWWNGIEIIGRGQ